jgi:hypothetical protein
MSETHKIDCMQEAAEMLTAANKLARELAPGGGDHRAAALALLASATTLRAATIVAGELETIAGELKIMTNEI